MSEDLATEALLESLNGCEAGSAPKGFWQNSGFQYWFDMKNENVVDRRKIA